MIKSFLSWFFGILFLLGAINALIAGNISICIPDLIIAVILIPPVWKYIEDAFDFKLTFGIKAFIVCACFILQIGAAIYSIPAVRGIIDIYFTTKNTPNEMKELIKKESKVDPSEIIKNASERDKKAVIKFENQFAQYINNCDNGNNSSAKTSDTNTSIQACTKSYNNVSKMNVPTFLPKKVKDLLTDAQQEYLNEDSAGLEFLKGPSNGGTKLWFKLDNLSRLAELLKYIGKNATTFKIKLKKARIIMGIPENAIKPIT